MDCVCGVAQWYTHPAELMCGQSEKTLNQLAIGAFYHDHMFFDTDIFIIILLFCVHH